MLIFPKLVRRLPRSRRTATEIYITYEDGRELLRTVLIKCTGLHFAVDHVRLDRNRAFESHDEAVDMADYEGMETEQRPGRHTVTLRMQVGGRQPISRLIATLSEIEGLHEVGTMNEDVEAEPD
jgi:putative Mg2+ transporter-C (MgtC) family protein